MREECEHTYINLKNLLLSSAEKMVFPDSEVESLGFVRSDNNAFNRFEHTMFADDVEHFERIFKGYRMLISHAVYNILEGDGFPFTHVIDIQLFSPANKIIKKDEITFNVD